MAHIFRYIVTTEHVPTGTLCQSTCHYQTDVPIAGTEPSAATVLDKLDSHFSTSGKNLLKFGNAMFSSLRIVRTQVRQEVAPNSGDIPEVAEATYSLTGQLSSSEQWMPVALCPWIRFNTGQAIRSGRGGTHAPPTLDRNQTDADRLFNSGTSYWTAVSALATSYADKLDNVFSETGDINPGVYSRIRHARGDTPYFFELTGAVATRKPRWLRRRETSP